MATLKNSLRNSYTGKISKPECNQMRPSIAKPATKYGLIKHLLTSQNLDQ